MPGFMIHLTVLKTFQVVHLQVLMIQRLMSFLSLCTKWNTLPILPVVVDEDVDLAEVVGAGLAELVGVGLAQLVGVGLAEVVGVAEDV